MMEYLEEGGRRKEEGEMFEDGTLLEECGMWNVEGEMFEEEGVLEERGVFEEGGRRKEEGEMFKMSLFSKRTSAPRVWAFCFAI